MAVYRIPECNIQAFRKKVKTIEKKCKVYGNTFSYCEIGDIYENRTIDGNLMRIKLIVVDIEGIAKINGWKLIAEVEDVPSESKNFVSVYDTDIEVPENYWIDKLHCDHCHTKHNRKKAFIIYNDETGEFKEVGKRCLIDYTHGLSGEAVAYTCEFLDDLQNEKSDFYRISSSKTYYNVDACLRIAYECFNKFGWHNKSEERSTYEDAINIYRFGHGMIKDGDEIDRIENHMMLVDFNDKDEKYNDKIKDLKIKLKEYDGKYGLEPRDVRNIVSNEYVDRSKLGILVYLPVIYSRMVQDREKFDKYNQWDDVSDYVGQSGDKIEFDTQFCDMVSSYEGKYGYTYVYKFVDTAGNMFTWFASKPITMSIEDLKDVRHVRGTVKGHSKYKGTKQTILTRCKIIFKQEESVHPEGTFDLNCLNVLYND